VTPSLAARRFPPPWTLDEHPESFIVRDANGNRSGISISRKNPVGA
jgi:hypothetical protein